MIFSKTIGSLIEAFQCFPGIGPRSAQRMVFHLLLRNRQAGEKLVASLQDALDNVRSCSVCRTLSESEVCDICSDRSRNKNYLCIVHNPGDILGIEKTHSYKGYYFVLNGHLSPIDGIDSEKLGIPLLISRLKEHPVEELILAVNNSPEGEMTAYYIQQHAQAYAKEVTRLAQGLPMGAEVEHMDSHTLGLALNHRRIF